jgi:hypothetical protein
VSRAARRCSQRSLPRDLGRERQSHPPFARSCQSAERVTAVVAGGSRSRPEHAMQGRPRSSRDQHGTTAAIESAARDDLALSPPDISRPSANHREPGGVSPVARPGSPLPRRAVAPRPSHRSSPVLTGPQEQVNGVRRSSRDRRQRSVSGGAQASGRMASLGSRTPGSGDRTSSRIEIAIPAQPIAIPARTPIDSARAAARSAPSG